MESNIEEIKTDLDNDISNEIKTDIPRESKKNTGKDQNIYGKPPTGFFRVIIKSPKEPGWEAIDIKKKPVIDSKGGRTTLDIFEAKLNRNPDYFIKIIKGN